VSDVLEKVRRSIEQHRLLTAGDALVVGVSGGPDSLCLLHVLCRLKQEYRLTLHVAHLHHGLRGADADADADFVRALAADWGLSCSIEQADVFGLAQEHRLAIEEAARRARYSFIGRVAQEIGARTIATGHNADDQAETILMHWIRGSGLAGLRGMRPLTPLVDYRLLEVPASSVPTPDIQLIRPLLEVTRNEIEAYCRANGLQPRFDRSNLDTTIFRNWLRHEVLPLLRRHNPNIGEVLRRSARVIADDYALLRAVLEETWPRVVLQENANAIAFDLERWRSLPTSLQRSTLREAIHRLRSSLRDISFLHVENALLVAHDGTTGDRATLPRGLGLLLDYDRIVVADARTPQPVPKWPLLPSDSVPFLVFTPGTTPLPGAEWLLHVKSLARSELLAGWEGNPDPWRAFLDAQVVGSPLWLRRRQPGDWFQPLGMGGHAVKLADFLTNRKVPQLVRDRLPLLVGPQGIVWVCGHRLDERARVRDQTESVLAVHLLHA
jgi:tRNA(Ile)-lysidine synthase